MKIFRQQNCDIAIKNILLIATVVSTIIATTICKENKFV